MTFKNSIRKLIKAEGYRLCDYESDAKSMDDNLIYVVRFCRENDILLNYDNAKGLLIGVWSLVGESDFTSEAPVDSLIKENLAACKA